MKTYEILYSAPNAHSTPELNNYLHSRIEQIGKEFSIVERCEVTLQKNHSTHGECEVKARLFLPRYVYTSRENQRDFMEAVQIVFDELNQQLQELVERMHDKALTINAGFQATV